MLGGKAMFGRIFKSFYLSLLVSSVFLLPAISQQEDFLVGYWAFEEGSGKVVTDQSGKGNDGKINGEVKWVNGKFGKALEFAPGANVEIPDSPTLKDMDIYTIALWINFNEFSPDWNHIFEKDGSYGLTVNTASGDFRFTPNSSKVWLESKFKVKEKTWYYITMTAESSGITFYVDGNKQAEAKEPIVYTNNVVNIAHGPSYRVNGIIDEVKFWAKALTPDEIKIAMKGNLSVFASKEKLIDTWGKIKSN